MLTKEEYSRCNDTRMVAEHLQYFCHYWSNQEDCPQHYEDMIRRFIALSPKEQRQYYVIDNVLYTIDQVSENYQFMNPAGSPYSKFTRGWHKTTK